MLNQSDWPLKDYESQVNFWLLIFSQFRFTYDSAPHGFDLGFRFLTGKSASETAQEIVALLTQGENTLIM
jgi:hypothetical protein